MGTVTVTFHGAVALVPNANNTQMRVLLGRFPPTEGVKPQVAYIRFPRSSYDPKKNSRQLVGPPPGTTGPAGSDAHVVLDGEFLSLQGIADKKFSPNIAKDPISDTPTALDEKSLHWLPHIGRVTPGAGTICPALMANPMSPATQPGLAARIDLTKGKLETDGVMREQVIFASPDGRDIPPQSIARAAVLTVNVSSDALTLKSSPLVKGVKFKSRDIRLAVPKNGHINVVIGNEPVEDIYVDAPQFPTGDSKLQAEAEAREFGLYYNLSAQPPNGTAALPQLTGKRPSGQLCAVGVFEEETP